MRMKARVEGKAIVLSFIHRAPKEVFLKARNEAPFVFGPGLGAEVQRNNIGLDVVRLVCRKLPTQERWLDAVQDFKQESGIKIVSRLRELGTEKVKEAAEKTKSKPCRRGKYDHMGKRRWSDADKRRLVKYFMEGWTDAQIAVIMSRTEHSIRSQRQKMGLRTSDRGKMSSSTLVTTIVGIISDIDAIKNKLGME